MSLSYSTDSHSNDVNISPHLPSLQNQRLLTDSKLNPYNSRGQRHQNPQQRIRFIPSSSDTSLNCTDILSESTASDPRHQIPFSLASLSKMFRRGISFRLADTVVPAQVSSTPPSRAGRYEGAVKKNAQVSMETVSVVSIVAIIDSEGASGRVYNSLPEAYYLVLRIEVHGNHIFRITTGYP